VLCVIEDINMYSIFFPRIYRLSLVSCYCTNSPYSSSFFCPIHLDKTSVYY